MKGGTLWICGYPWKVALPNEELFHKGVKVLGLTDRHEHTITVSTLGINEDKIRSTLLHEMIHAAFVVITNGYPDDEESCCQTIEVALFGALRDTRNRWFWKQIGVVT